MISTDTRPQLAAKARLRFDRKSTRYLLLYPERGLELNATAADIVRLCTGEHTVAGIVDRLVEKYSDRPRDVVEHETMSFLATLASRGLLEERQ